MIGYQACVKRHGRCACGDSGNRKVSALDSSRKCLKNNINHNVHETEGAVLLVSTCRVHMSMSAIDVGLFVFFLSLLFLVLNLEKNTHFPFVHNLDV